MKPENQQMIEKLTERILFLKRKYYAGNPVVSDREFDQLEQELRRLAPDHPILSMVGSDVVSPDAKKVTHRTPMLSLEKTYEIESLLKWIDERGVMASLKIDGVSMSLVYSEGKLTLAKTRGNGQEGEEVTDKIRWLTDCPLELPGLADKPMPKNLEIRGELYCTTGQFAKLADAMAALELEAPTSPRNIVAGILGRKNRVTWLDSSVLQPSI